jgi:hypothetical protein
VRDSVTSIRLALLSGLVALLALVAGCGDDEDMTTTQAPTTEATTEAESAPPPAETSEDEGGAEAEDAGGGAAGSPGDDPEFTLEAYFLSGDPDLVCGELATESLVRTAYGDEQGCRQAQVPSAIPKSIEIRSLDVSGDEAEAVVTPTGGPNDGIETMVTLVDDDGWRVDTLEADVPAGP